MTEKELKTIEAELQKRGYRKWTTALTSTETYSWFKSFNKEEDEDAHVISGYQIAFRVWDFRKYVDRNAPTTSVRSGIVRTSKPSARCMQSDRKLITNQIYLRYE